MLLKTDTWADSQVDIEQGGTASVYEKRSSIQHAMGSTNILSKSIMWRVHSETSEDRPKTSVRSCMSQMQDKGLFDV